MTRIIEMPDDKGKDLGARADGTGLSQAEPQEGLGPTGFDPSRDILALLRAERDSLIVETGDDFADGYIHAMDRAIDIVAGVR